MKLAVVAASSLLLAFALENTTRAADTVAACISASTDGQTLRKEGKLLAAREQLLACARPACPAVIRSHCVRWAAEMDPLIPSIVVRAQDPHGVDLIDARVAIDGKAAKLDGNPVQLDPGGHTVVVEKHEGGAKEQKIMLASGEHARLVVVRFEPSAPAPPSPHVASAEPAPDEPTHRIPAGVWVLGGAGLAVAGGGVYFIVTAISDRNQLAATCAPNCTNAQTQPGRTDVLVADILFGVGGAAVVGALIWAVAAPDTADVAPPIAKWLPRFDVHPVTGGAMTGLTFRW